jgi:hypothetical protein
MRSDVDGARYELFAGAAFAGDQDVEVVPLHPLDLLHDAVHGGAGGQKPRQQRLERTIDREVGHRGVPVARGAQRKALAGDRSNHPQTPHDRMTDRPWRCNEAEARSLVVAPERFHEDGPSPVGVAVRRGAGNGPRRVGFAAGGGDHAHIAAGQLDKNHAAVGRGSLEQRCGGLAPEQFGQGRGVDDPAHDGIVRIRR